MSEEDENIEEENEENQEKLNKKQEKLSKMKDEIECENTILEEKQRFGRVRTSVMRYMREKYGYTVANRVMWRIDKRIKNHSFTK